MWNPQQASVWLVANERNQKLALFCIQTVLKLKNTTFPRRNQFAQFDRLGRLPLKVRSYSWLMSRTEGNSTSWTGRLWLAR